MLEEKPWSPAFSECESFYTENNLKANATARWALNDTGFDRNQLCKIGLKMKKNNCSRMRWGVVYLKQYQRSAWLKR